ncbi:MAG: chorismate synthase [Dehalococcoidia bacterium]
MFRFLTAGESHGPALSVIVDGVPAGIPLDEEWIAKDLARRQWGHGRGQRQKIEKDYAAIEAGVRFGMTLGSPVALRIENRDWTNWRTKMSASPVDVEVPKVSRMRPGHADLPGALKYQQDDIRNVLERASARETAARVAAGAVARRFLDEFGVTVRSHTVAIGGVTNPMMDGDERDIDWDAVEESPVHCADHQVEERMIEVIDEARMDGDTVGGVFEVIATGAPIGLGSHVQWDRKLSGRIGQAMMSVNAVKGVEIGGGFRIAHLRGSLVHDVIRFTDDPGASFNWSHSTNRAGGIVGGMTNGEAIVVRVALKPISTLAKPLPSVDLQTGEPVIAHYERSDVCVVPAAGVVGEAMLCLVLARTYLEKFGGDHLAETRRNFEAYVRAVQKKTENEQSAFALEEGLEPVL